MGSAHSISIPGWPTCAPRPPAAIWAPLVSDPETPAIVRTRAPPTRVTAGSLSAVPRRPGCPRQIPRTSSPGWMPSAAPARCRARGHRTVTTGGARCVPSPSRPGCVAVGPHGRPSCHRTRAGLARAPQAVGRFEAQHYATF
jgi:hypothetical protein